MRKQTRHIVHAAIFAALYAVLTHFQNLLLPGSASWALQIRISEALCVFSFFTPSAALGLSLGCLIFNLTFAPALPLDFLLGPLATYAACRLMHRLRLHPFLGMCMPALTNGLLIGGELTLYIGGGFLPNAAYVATGQLLALYLPGALLYRIIRSRRLDQRLFS